MSASRTWVASLVGAAAMVVTLGVPPTSAAVLATARNDSYSVVTGTLLTVPAPGVLDNDTFVAGAGAADLRNDVDYGTLTLDDDGGFRYQPANGFVGTDQFKYRIPGGVLLLLPSNTATVTITVTAPPPAPTPTPAPTPAPTPTPTPKPTATPTPTLQPPPALTPPPAPTIAPLPTVRPLPTLPSLPAPTPIASMQPTPTPRPSASGGERPATNTAPSNPPVIAPAGPIGSGGGGATTRPGSGDRAGPAGPDAAVEPFVVPAAGVGDGLDFDASSISFAGFEWAVPALVLTVPGILIVIAVVVQAMIGLVWLPVARRWLDGDRRRRRPALAAVSSR
jgi:Big-like domain-containing protein